MLQKAKSTATDIYQAYQNWQENDGSHLAASVSFYTAVSFFPLLLVLISAMGFAIRFSGWGQDARDHLLDVIAEQTAPALTRQLGAVLSNVEESAVIGGPVGIAMLLVASMAVLGFHGGFHAADSAIPPPRASLARSWAEPLGRRPIGGFLRKESVGCAGHTGNQAEEDGVHSTPYGLRLLDSGPLRWCPVSWGSGHV